MKKNILSLLLALFVINANCQKHCLLWPEEGATGTPAYLIDRWSFIETLPFDGVVIFPPNYLYHTVMQPGQTVSYQQVYTDSRLGELSAKFNKVKHNYLMAWCRKAEFFDDATWTTIVQNFANYAKAAKDAGIAGIVFDNEQYIENPWKYPDAVDYSSTKTLAQYQAQVRLRGKQVMAAMIAQFPNIEVITAHGPHWSEPKFNELLLPNPTYGDVQLAGSFYIGFVEAVIDAKAAGKSPKAIDAGEFYKPRTVQEFDDLYQFRKTYMASTENNSAQIPASLRSTWASNFSVSQAVSNQTQEAPQSPAIMRTTMENAARRADDVVWFYSVKLDWYTSGAVSQDWITAVRDGFNAGTASSVGPEGYTYCAEETQSFNIKYAGTCDVAFGANGKFNYLTGKTGTIAFNTATFGDPIPGVAKKGYYKIASDAPPGYTYCAEETQSFALPSTSDVAYGANGKFNYLYGKTGTIAFNNTTFGGDPIPGVAKKGYYKKVNSISAPTNLQPSNITKTSFTLSWAASSGATAYDVYKDGVKYGGIFTGTPPATSLSITGLTCGKTYSMIVYGMNSAGTWSAASVAKPVLTTACNASAANLISVLNEEMSKISSDILVSPNPSSTIVNITNIAGSSSVTVHSIDGKIVLKIGKVFKNNVSFDVSAWSKGTYILQVQSERGSMVKKIIVK